MSYRKSNSFTERGRRGVFGAFLHRGVSTDVGERERKREEPAMRKDSRLLSPTSLHRGGRHPKRLKGGSKTQMTGISHPIWP